MKTILLLAAASIVLCACTTPTVFKDAKSGQIAQCTASSGGFFPIAAQHEIDTCSETFTRMGWVKQ